MYGGGLGGSPSGYFPPVTMGISRGFTPPQQMSFSSLENTSPSNPDPDSSNDFDHMVSPSAQPPKRVLTALRLDVCTLRAGSSSSLDVLAHSIRSSAIRHLSLRGNKVGVNGGISLALMIKDYPDSVGSTSGVSTGQSVGSPSALGFSPYLNSPKLRSSPLAPSSRTSSLTNLESLASPTLSSPFQSPNPTPNQSVPAGASLSSPSNVSLSSLPSPPATPPPGTPKPLTGGTGRELSPSVGPGASAGKPIPSPLTLPPPPRHPSLGLTPKPSSSAAFSSPSNLASNPQQKVLTTTYTPYIPKSRRLASAAGASPMPPPNNNATSSNVPTFASSRAGGVTARLTNALSGTRSVSGQPSSTAPAGRAGVGGGKSGLDARLAAAAAGASSALGGIAGMSGLGRREGSPASSLRSSSLSTARPSSSSTSTNTIISSSASGTTLVPSTPPPGVLDGHSAALLESIRSLESLPRIGCLQTLDLRGNDLRVRFRF